jgi:GrpB-like predicted nucleotidyltransferase (UPF0157 family)
MAPTDDPIAAYDPRWPVWFLKERSRLAAAVGTDALAIEHVGTSSVPGLEGRAVIDILIGVGAGADALGRVRAAVAALGYEDLGEAGVPGRVTLRRRADQAFEIAVVEHGGKLWSDVVAIRDLLRRDPEVAKAYGARKRAVAAGEGAFPADAVQRPLPKTLGEPPDEPPKD